MPASSPFRLGTPPFFCTATFFGCTCAGIHHAHTAAAHRQPQDTDDVRDALRGLVEIRRDAKRVHIRRNVKKDGRMRLSSHPAAWFRSSKGRERSPTTDHGAGGSAGAEPSSTTT
jgi:hypothetical protein